MSGYTRQDTGNNIANGKIIDADYLDEEYNALEQAFSSTTGHAHDGTSGEGAPIVVVGPAQDFVATGTDLSPKTDSAYTLGTTANRWSEVFADEVTIGDGAITWNTDERTLDVVLNATGVTLQVGQEVLVRVQNNTGSSLANGTLVQYAGSIGASGFFRVEPFDATSAGNPRHLIGVLTEDVANGDVGFATAFGKVRGIDTLAVSAGTVLWADPTNPGGFTDVEPEAPNHKLPVAVVLIQSATVGTLFVRTIGLGTNLADDSLVQLSSLANNDVLVYNSTSGRFENQDTVDLTTVTADDVVVTGQIEIPVGSDTAPSIYFGGDTGLGVFRESSGMLGVSGDLRIGSTLPKIVAEDTDNVSRGEITFSQGNLTISADTGNQLANSAITFDVDNSEKVRITATGRLGVGTASPSNDLHVVGSGQVTGTFTVGDDFIIPDKIIHSGDTDTSIRFPTADTITFETAGTEAMRVSSANSVGIGTSSIPNKLTVAGSASATSLFVNRTSGNGAELLSVNGGLAVGGLNGLNLATGVLDGAFFTTDAGSAISTDGAIGLTIRRRNTDGGMVVFRRGTTQVGSISATTVATSYNTSSDYRLKEDFLEISDAVERLRALKPYNFAWRSNKERTEGFLAHDLQKVLPWAVTGKKDEVDESGEPVYQSVDHSKLTPLLTAALQKALNKIDELEARISLLESKA